MNKNKNQNKCDPLYRNEECPPNAHFHVIDSWSVYIVKNHIKFDVEVLVFLDSPNIKVSPISFSRKPSASSQKRFA